MGFGCKIVTKDGEITGFENGKLNYQLLGLDYFGAPFRTGNFRTVMNFPKTITGTHAQYQYNTLRNMVLENIAHAARKLHASCPKCDCVDSNFELTEGMKIIIETDVEDILSIEGGW